MSCKYEPGTLRRTRIYVNAAFARLSGVHPEEMVARCGVALGCTGVERVEVEGA